MMKNTITFLLALTIFYSCLSTLPDSSFEKDLVFLKKFKETIVLKNNGGLSQIAVIPDYQGRVMTSTSNGAEGRSYGWVNDDLISSGEFTKHMNAFGGEDRFWMGPEGGQFSIFFEKDKAFTLENWFTPPQIDSEPFDIIQQNDTSVAFRKQMQLTNYQGFNFDIEVNRIVSIFSKENIEKSLSVSIPDQVSYVGFQSDNSITNIGSEAWSYSGGLLSIWILGMFVPTENTVVIIPYRDSLDLNTSYFGPIGSDRLLVTENVVLFKGDGKYRCKIGLPPKNALPVLGSYDMDNEVLTLVQYSFEGDSSYVNSLWEHQENPYSGDVINSYNDGPLEDGSMLGPFYELESSSSSRELGSGEMIQHIHRTYHFEGSIDSLSPIAKKVLDVNLSEITSKVKSSWR